MKKLFFILFLLAGYSNMTHAQILAFKPTTGDAEMDGILTDIHNKAIKDISGFTSNVVSTFSLVNSKVEAALKILAPGDVFMAAQLASTVNKPFDEVVKSYQANKSKGWGAMAKEMGIKPGSAEFHAMKKSMKSKGNSGSKAKGNAGGKGNGNAGKGKKK